MLATTRNYLMVLKTTYRDPKTGKELCGFTSKMGSAAPAPRLLRLKTGAQLRGPRGLERGGSGCSRQRLMHATPNKPAALPMLPLPLPGAEDARLTKGAPLEKAKFTWITERGRQENFRAVKVAEPEAGVSCGGLTTVTTYHLVKKNEDVVDSGACMGAELALC